MLCFFHRNDLDGVCSGAIVKKFHPNVELIGIDYGEPFPWDRVEGQEVFMVDFSLQPFSDMIKLANMCNLTWIDHHDSAIKDMDASGFMFNGTQKRGMGACDLTWRVLCDDPVPECVRLLAEYDVWKHDDPQVLPFQYGLRLADTKVDSEVWEDVFLSDEAFIHNVCNTGQIVLDTQAHDNMIKAKTLSFEARLVGVLGGLRLLCANYGPSNSKFFDSVWDSTKYDAMCLFYWKPKIKRWTVSLYSDKPSVDLGQIAKSFGGGGHKLAAGFNCEFDDLPFDIFRGSWMG